MAKTTNTRIRDLPKDTQLEILRHKAKVEQAKVDKADAQREIDTNRAKIDQLKEGN